MPRSTCCAVPAVPGSTLFSTDTCLQAVGYLALKQQLSTQLLDHNNISSSNTNNTPTVKQLAAQPARSGSQLQAALSGTSGTLQVTALFPNSPCPPNSSSNTLLANAYGASPAKHAS